MKIRQATLSDCFELAPRMRQIDQDEVLQSGHATVLTALTESFVTSKEAFTCETNEGLVIAIGGVVEIQGYGVPWLLASDEVFNYRKNLLKVPAAHVKRWASEYKGLLNCCLKANKLSIAWLRRMGFEFHPAPFKGAEWTLFTMKGGHLV